MEYKNTLKVQKIQHIMIFLKRFLPKDIVWYLHKKIIINHSRHRYIVEQIWRFYENPPPDFKLNISSQLLDYFCYFYLRDHKFLVINGLNIYQDFRENLKCYSKKYFDAFCRRNKLGQMVFFKWCYESGVSEYLRDRDHHKEVKDHMHARRRLLHL